MNIDGNSKFYPGTLPAPRNAWYVVAFSDEVTEKPLSRRILGDRLVFYRTDAGTPVALADYCAHRAMALSQGKRVEGNRLRCLYHGLEYDNQGTCVRIPSQSQIPGKMKVRAYPLAERWQWIWAWMGDPNEADESLIPDHSLFGLAPDDGFFKIQRFRMDIPGSFQLVHENLLDGSHVTFLHEGAFDSGKIAEVPAITEVSDNVITITRAATEVVTGSYAKLFEIADGTRVNRQMIAKSWVPNLNVVTNIFEFPDEPNRPLAIRHSPFGITPETNTTCHYFAVATGNYGTKPEGEALKASNQAIWNVFLEDKVAIEAIQTAYMEFGADTPDTSVRADDAALRFRRMLLKQAMESGSDSRAAEKPRQAAALHAN